MVAPLFGRVADSGHKPDGTGERQMLRAPDLAGSTVLLSLADVHAFNPAYSGVKTRSGCPKNLNAIQQRSSAAVAFRP